MKKRGSKKPARKRINSPFSKNLNSLLEERGVSQRAAAEIAGVSPATITDWLSGSQPSDTMAVLKLCKALGADFQWLLTGSRSEPRKGDINLTEIFNMEDEPAFSGIFQIEAKRLLPKKQDEDE